MTRCGDIARLFLAHAHFRHISISGGSSGDGFRIAVLISNSCNHRTI